jgi:hypothetical protein
MSNTRGYYFVNGEIGNIFGDASLLEIVEQLESCSYRCEAGPLVLNLAFQELRRRAAATSLTSSGGCVQKAEYTLGVHGSSQDFTYACSEHLAEMLEPGVTVVSTEGIPDGEVCCFIRTVEDKEV